MKRGFLLGKFMPPHAGHVTLIQSARALVDELTVLLCSLPDDAIPGEQRLEWMRQLFPDCRIVWHSKPVPQAPSDDPKFWKTWTGIVARAHPESIDYLFAGEAYGAELAEHVGGIFVPLGGRILNADLHGIGGMSGEKVRADPWRYWSYLPPPVRNHYAVTVCLHGIEPGPPERQHRPGPRADQPARLRPVPVRGRDPRGPGHRADRRQHPPRRRRAASSDTFKKPTSRTWLNGQEAVSMTITKQSGSNEIATVDGVKAEIDAAEPGPAERRQDLDHLDNSVATRNSLAGVQRSLIEAVRPDGPGAAGLPAHPAQHDHRAVRDPDLADLDLPGDAASSGSP